MQELASVPLFVTADLEGGTGLIFRGGTRFPKAMALGATFTPENARQVGRLTALEAKSIGVNVNFYPVADVNNNPLNPIINTRSFGEDPEQVANMTKAYVEGFQENGLIATAKHFPGHGDTSIDSHLQLPVIRASRERLNRVELLPFQRAIQAGVRAIMTSHLVVPALEPQQDVPATLSKRISTSLLREELGFKGLVFTDAMNMGSLRYLYGNQGAIVQAFAAGADLILFPPSVKRAFQSLKNALQQGKISHSRLDKSVHRILGEKARLGFHRDLSSSLSQIDSVVASPKHLESSQKIIDQAITLVSDKNNALPLSPKQASEVLLLTILDESRLRESRGDVLMSELLRRHRQTQHIEVLPDILDDKLKLIFKRAGEVDYVVVGIYVRTAANKGSLGLSQSEMHLLESLASSETPIYFIFLGSPYLLPLADKLPTYITIYDDYPGAEVAAIKAIFGEIQFRGKLPISLPGLYPIGHGIRK